MGPEADDATINRYEVAAKKAGIIIAEVGAWSNPLGPDANARNQALEKCKVSLDLADRIGARCCVNIAGSRGERWDGPFPGDLTEETFEMIVTTVREIIDAVKPKRTFYSIETMPWMYPDSVDSYLDLIRAVDRERLAVHLDPANLINSPQRYFMNSELLRECFDKLGERIRSCHAKDVSMEPRLTVHLDEVRPGLGDLDYRTYLGLAAKLDRDLPIMLEHLPSSAEYHLAANYVRSIADSEGLHFV